MKTPTIAAPTITPVTMANANRIENVYMNQLTALNRRNERDAHFFGSVKLEGIWYQASTWINVNNNVQNLSTSFTKMNEAQAVLAEERQAKFEAERALRANPLTAPAVAAPEKAATPVQAKLTLEQCGLVKMPATNPMHPEYVGDDIPF